MISLSINTIAPIIGTITLLVIVGVILLCEFIGGEHDGEFDIKIAMLLTCFIFGAAALAFMIADYNTDKHKTKTNNTEIAGEVKTDTTIEAIEATESTEESYSVSEVKLAVYTAYPSAEINYSKINSTGYFKADDEYYSFILDGDNIVIRDSSEKIVNIIDCKKLLSKD